MADTPAEPSLKPGRALVPALSFNGELSRAREKRFEETIVFVPFFGAKKAQLRRHAEFVNRLGFDCVLFDLKFSIDQTLVSARAGFGLKHVWADQIEKILNEVPGRKIVFSFSNPSASAIEAIARRNATDITALICDGGPSAKLLLSMVNYYRVEEPIRFAPARWLAALTGTLAWSPRFMEIIHADLRRLPKNFRILSIRGWKDPLISPDHIDQVFEPHTHLDWTKLSLPKGAHLNGLKDFRDEYAPPVTRFLESVATLLEPGPKS